MQTHCCVGKRRSDTNHWSSLQVTNDTLQLVGIISSLAKAMPRHLMHIRIPKHIERMCSLDLNHDGIYGLHTEDVFSSPVVSGAGSL